MANAAITVDINARIAQFESEIKRATSTLDGFGARASAISSGIGKGFAALGAVVGVSSVIAFAKSGIDAADALNDLSDRTGVAVRDLAAFELAAKLADTSLDSVGAGVAKLTRSIGEAERGNKGIAAALSELGVSARDPREAFLQLADGVERINDPARRAVLLNQVLGKSYSELLPLLQQGGDELRRMADESGSYAESMEGFAKESARFNDALDALGQKAKAAATVGLLPLVEAVNRVFDRFQKIAEISNGGASIIDILVGRVSADTTASLARVQQSITDLSADIERLRRNSGGLDGSIAPLQAELDRQKKLRTALIEQAAREGQTPPKNTASSNAKDQTQAAVDDTIRLGAELQAALGKAFSDNPLEDFVKSFADKRKQIAAEYDALRAQFSGSALTPATSLDVNAAIGRGRFALESGDFEAAKRAAEQAKSLFSTVAAQEGTASFEKSYLLREMERLETQMVDASESTAQKMRAAIDAQLAQINQDAATLNVSVDASDIVAQIKSAVSAARKELVADPLRVPVVSLPALGQGISTTSDGRQSVDISRTALQYGRRR